MAIAVAQRMRDSFKDPCMTVPLRFGSFEDRARHGFFLTSNFSGKRQICLRLYSRVVSSSMRGRLGWVAESEIRAVLDASGFAYSDQWGLQHADVLSRRMSRKARMGQKLILLPQALGPFSSGEAAGSFKRLADRASLIFARDEDSLRMAKEIAGEGRIRLSPDITIPLQGVVPDWWDRSKRFGAIVPNCRMVDRQADADMGAYVKALAGIVRAIKEEDLRPVVVLHAGAEDRILSDALKECAGPVEVVESEDPLVLKGILGEATVVVGSRYHALVSALSQSVPCIGLGWSHKYFRLFEDFGCGDLYLEDGLVPGRVGTALRELLRSAHRDRIVTVLREKGTVLRDRVNGMWAEVEAFIGSARP